MSLIKQYGENKSALYDNSQQMLNDALWNSTVINWDTIWQSYADL